MKQDFAGETYFVIRKGNEYKIYPYNAEVAYAYYESVQFIKALAAQPICGAV